MKNLMYVLAIAVMGLVACGAPAENAEVVEETTTEETTATADTVEVVAEEAEMDTTATEEAAE
ncbi:hypothetical protein N9V65_02230 [Flavobacteriales bacterium]|jgi:hypothetical protein|nr:hypothetical protein [Flavobacteriales bacterium]